MGDPCGVRGSGGWAVVGGGRLEDGSLQTPIHMEKQLKNHQSNRRTDPSPGRKRQKLKKPKSGGVGGGEKGGKGSGRVGRNSKVR